MSEPASNPLNEYSSPGIVGLLGRFAGARRSLSCAAEQQHFAPFEKARLSFQHGHVRWQHLLLVMHLAMVGATGGVLVAFRLLETRRAKAVVAYSMTAFFGSTRAL